tara:strand:+ start:150 stop:455 length:306 start_codon:yes stop_codon:yes gene_type:complete
MEIDKKSIVENIIREVSNVTCTDNEEIVFNENTVIYGCNSPLDSFALVNLLVAVEQNIEDEFDITIVLADDRAMSLEKSPFRTVISLADYIETLLREQLND